MPSSNRTFFYSRFADIARRQWLLVQENTQKLPAMIEKLSHLTGDDAKYFEYTDIDPIEVEIYHDCCIIIVMSALALEGYIYDYAARNLSDSLAEDVDKLDAIGKWVVVTQLVTGKNFPKDGKAYQLLKQLISDRNYLAHPKSAPTLVYDEKKDDLVISGKALRMQDFSQSIVDKAKNALSTIDELSLVMENLDPDESASFILGSMVGKKKEQIDKYGF